MTKFQLEQLLTTAIAERNALGARVSVLEVQLLAARGNIAAKPSKPAYTPRVVPQDELNRLARMATARAEAMRTGHSVLA